MPTIGPFHRNYWLARKNAITPAGTKTGWMYPGVQSVVTMSMAIWGVPLDAIRPLLMQLRWYLTLATRLWRWRAVANQEQLETWIARLEAVTAEEHAVLERVASAMRSPQWADARRAVRACATTPGFHDPAQWVAYSRLIKSNYGQAQNVFRHLKAVSALRTLADGEAPISNPDAHLLVELAYQGMALQPERPRQIVDHPKWIVAHPKVLVTR